MTVHTSSARRQAGMDAIYDALNGGTLEFRVGAQEANPEAAASGTLLCTNTLNATAFAAAVGGAGAAVTKTANAIASAVIAATGVCGHFRLVTAGAVCVLIGDYAAAAADINGPVNFGAGATLSVTSLVLSMAY